MQTTRIELEGALNFRDLGGFAARGGTTARGKLYRSDALSDLTEQDTARLLALGLRTAVDLRREHELVESPSVFANHATVHYHHNPVSEPDSQGEPPHERLQRLDFAALYVAMARASSATFAYLFHLLADADTYPLVFHCAGGRDRTGVAAALILSAAGVSRADIVADYLISNEYLVKRMARMRADYLSRGIDPEPIMANIHLREAYLTALLDMVDNDRGGIDGYLESIGVSQTEITRFRNVFIVTSV